MTKIKICPACLEKPKKIVSYCGWRGYMHFKCCFESKPSDSTNERIINWNNAVKEYKNLKFLRILTVPG